MVSGYIEPSLYENRLFKETCWYWGKGVDSLRRSQDHCLIFSVTQGSLLLAATVCWTGDTYICLQYLYFVHVFMVSLGLVAFFFTLLMFAMIPLTSYANILYIIVDLCWFRFDDVCHVVKLMIDIITHVIYVPIVWSCLISEFLLNIFKIINAVVSLADLISG